MKKVVIHTDGGCHGNPGPGGWAAILSHGKHTREISGGEPATTNNRMELLAAIEALKALKNPCAVEFHTDSKYLKNGVTCWLHTWKRNGWKTSAKKVVKNADLWRELDRVAPLHQVEWKWVKGHAGDTGNERCDKLANEEIAKIKNAFSSAQLKELLAQFSAKDGEPVSERLI
jgi:ribonuclease HI